jgi:hypothetical protein
MSIIKSDVWHAVRIELPNKKMHDTGWGAIDLDEALAYTKKLGRGVHWDILRSKITREVVVESLTLEVNVPRPKKVKKGKKSTWIPHRWRKKKI